MEIGADAAPFLARRAGLAGGGIEHLFDAGDAGFARACAGEVNGRRLERNPELGQRQFAEVNRRDDPVARPSRRTNSSPSSRTSAARIGVREPRTRLSSQRSVSRSPGPRSRDRIISPS